MSETPRRKPCTRQGCGKSAALLLRRLPPYMAPTGASREAERSRDLPLRDHALELAVLVDLAVHRARPDQVLVHAACGDAAVLEDDDLVGERDRRQAMGDDDRRPAAHRLAQARADARLRRRVD